MNRPAALLVLLLQAINVCWAFLYGASSSRPQVVSLGGLYGQHSSPSYGSGHGHSSFGRTIGHGFGGGHSFGSSHGHGRGRGYGHGGGHGHSHSHSHGFDVQIIHDDHHGHHDDHSHVITTVIGGHGGHGGHGSFGHHSSGGYGSHSHSSHHVPLLLKKHNKKQKIISVHHGFYVSGGTQAFGKFKTLHDCQKACEITATCFAGDFNPWLSKCYLHTNTTACSGMQAHPSIMHFKKVPCNLVETTRGLITLGTNIHGGLEQKGAKDLKACLKQCTTAGGGIAATTATIGSTPQLCFGIDYDFSTHKCYIHTDSALCPNDATILTPSRLVSNPSAVNILLCPLAA